MSERNESAEQAEPGDSDRLLDEVSRGNVLAENALMALPMRLLILDKDLNIVLANPAYCRQRGLSVEEVQEKSIADIFPSSLLEDAGLHAALISVLATGERVQWSGYRYATADHGERTLNICLVPMAGLYGERNVLLAMEDITQQYRQLYELLMLQQIAQVMLGRLELPRLLHAILTGMTAGGAAGLGFNRAFLMLIDEESSVLKVEMAIGPADVDEAGRIWSEIGTYHQTVEAFLAEYDSLPAPEESRFYAMVSQLEMSLEDSAHVLASVLYDGETLHIVDAANDPRAPKNFLDHLKSNEFVIAPLVAKGRPIGVAYADNFISRRPLSQSDVQLFASLANHAALAINSAKAYRDAQRHIQELEETHQQLESAQEHSLRSEKLAAIGEMTAIVAHEIRNPLVTIGGFAKQILRQAEDPQRVQRNAEIIYDEVIRLENILSELLVVSRPRQPQFRWCDISEILHKRVDMVRARPHTTGIEISIECDPDLPQLYLDRGQINQVLDNLIRNAMDAMPEGGSLALSASTGADNKVIVRVSDTGTGIPPSYMEKMFDTFCSTKPNGMGLGLALVKKIINDHGAEMIVDSQLGEGTTFTLIPDLSYETGRR